MECPFCKFDFNPKTVKTITCPKCFQSIETYSLLKDKDGAMTIVKGYKRNRLTTGTYETCNAAMQAETLMSLLDD